MIVNLNQIYIEDHTKINLEIKKLKIDKENVSININMSNNLMIDLTKAEDVEIVMMNDDLFKDHIKIFMASRNDMDIVIKGITYENASKQLQEIKQAGISAIFSMEGKIKENNEKNNSFKVEIYKPNQNAMINKRQKS
jgi:hypothetical protein